MLSLRNLISNWHLPTHTSSSHSAPLVFGNFLSLWLWLERSHSICPFVAGLCHLAGLQGSPMLKHMIELPFFKTKETWWCKSVIPALRGLRQRQFKLKASSGYSVRPSPYASPPPTRRLACLCVCVCIIQVIYIIYTRLPCMRVLLLFVCICAPVSENTHTHDDALNTPELELEVAVSCLTWILGTELRSLAIKP